MEIKTISNEISDMLIVSKSKFIAYLFPCDSKEEAKDILLKLKEMHIEATHICYAYIINEDNVLLYKANDDNEPSQTAGAPILNVLRKNNLTNVLLAVVRYFGGIKLGAGGLTRTYSNAAALVVKSAAIVTLKEALLYKIYFPYDKVKEIDKILEINNIVINKKEYDDNIIYSLIIKDDEVVNDLKKKIEYLNVKFEKIDKIMIRTN